MKIPSNPHSSEKQKVSTTETPVATKSIDTAETTPQPRVKGKKENNFPVQKKSIESRTATYDANKP